jgi:hypothetical protein
MSLKEISSLCAIMIWKWGTPPEAPKIVDEITKYEIVKWAALLFIIRVFVTQSLERSVLYVLSVYIFKHFLENIDEKYYHEMWKKGEAAVENRFSIFK